MGYCVKVLDAQAWDLRLDSQHPIKLDMALLICNPALTWQGANRKIIETWPLRQPALLKTADPRFKDPFSRKDKKK